MMKIEDMKAGDSLDGIELASLVSVVAAAPISTGAVQLVYKTPDGALKERLLCTCSEDHPKPLFSST